MVSLAHLNSFNASSVGNLNQEEVIKTTFFNKRVTARKSVMLGDPDLAGFSSNSSAHNSVRTQE